MKPHEPGVEQSICLGETPNQNNYEGDGRPSQHQIGMCFWTPGSHMSYMGQGPFQYVSDITGSHSPASSPLVGEIPPWSSFPRVSPSPESLSRLGLLLQCHADPMVMHACWEAHP